LHPFLHMNSNNACAQHSIGIEQRTEHSHAVRVRDGQLFDCRAKTTGARNTHVLIKMSAASVIKRKRFGFCELCHPQEYNFEITMITEQGVPK